jgi:hypothetical protein
MEGNIIQYKCSLIFGKVLHQQEWLINNFSYDDLNGTYEPRGVYQPIMDGPLTAWLRKLIEEPIWTGKTLPICWSGFYLA